MKSMNSISEFFNMIFISQYDFVINLGFASQHRGMEGQYAILSQILAIGVK